MDLYFKHADNSSPIERAICLATGGPFSHVEVLRRGGFFSSRAPAGVSFAQQIDAWPYWTIVAAGPAPTPTVERWCQDQCGHGYDYVGALCAALGHGLRTSGRWFCSLVVREVLSREGVAGLPDLPSPVALYIHLTGATAAAAMTFVQQHDIIDQWWADSELVALVGCRCLNEVRTIIQEGEEECEA